MRPMFQVEHIEPWKNVEHIHNDFVENWWNCGEMALFHVEQFESVEKRGTYPQFTVDNLGVFVDNCQ